MFTEQRRKKKTIEFFIFIFIYTGIYVNFIAFSFAMSLLVVNNNCPHNCYQFHATTNCWSFWIMYELLFDVFSSLYKSSFFTIILNGFALAFFFFLVMMWDLKKVGPWNSPLKSKPQIPNPTHHNCVSSNPKDFFLWRFKPRMFGSTAHPSLPPLGCTLTDCSLFIIGLVHIYFGLLKCKRQTFPRMINLGNALFSNICHICLLSK